MLRFVGQLHPHAGRVVLLAPVGSLTTAVRLQYSLHEVYGCAADILGPGGRPHARTDQTQRDAPLTEPGRTGGTYQVLVTAGGADLGRRTGLTDRAGRMVRGLPSSLVAGGVCDAAAVWRGAFLVAGVLKNGTVPGLTLSCPGSETAMALVGAARRLGVPARSRELRGQQRVVVRDPAGVRRLLAAMGVRETLWVVQRSAVTRTGVGSVASFQDANQDRAQIAAARACAAVEHALEVLGDRVPAHLAEAAVLRLTHREASLEELGQRHADPPMTKDAIAGRLRRLVDLAERHTAPATSTRRTPTGSVGAHPTPSTPARGELRAEC